MSGEAGAGPPLSERIAQEIRDLGPMPLSRLMELALYDSAHGYYRGARDPFGKEGDFFTNSQLQPVFGRLLAGQAARWRAELGAPAEFQIVDWGCGRGETVEAIRQALPDVPVTGVETGTAEPPAGITGVILANELFDALPVDLVERRSKEIVECRVTTKDARLQWVACSASPAHVEYISRYAPDIADRQQIEVSFAGLKLLENLAGRLISGYLVVIDYGYTSQEIAAGRRFPNGSLMSYHRHQASAEILNDPGRRDITSHVNFSALEAHAKVLGFESLGLVSQTRFLLEAGEPDQFASALAAENEAESLRLRLQLKSLLVGLGETFRVLTLRK